MGNKTTVEELPSDSDEAKIANKGMQEVIAKMAKWREEGRCPYCGELGRFVGCAPVCSKHGPYSCKTEEGHIFDGGDPPKATRRTS